MAHWTHTSYSVHTLCITLWSIFAFHHFCCTVFWLRSNLAQRTVSPSCVEREPDWELFCPRNLFTADKQEDAGDSSFFKLNTATRPPREISSIFNYSHPEFKTQLKQGSLGMRRLTFNPKDSFRSEPEMLKWFFVRSPEKHSVFWSTDQYMMRCHWNKDSSPSSSSLHRWRPPPISNPLNPAAQHGPI